MCEGLAYRQEYFSTTKEHPVIIPAFVVNYWWLLVGLLGIIALFIITQPIRDLFDWLDFNDEQRNAIVGGVFVIGVLWWAGTSRSQTIVPSVQMRPAVIMVPTPFHSYLPGVAR